MEPVIPMIGRIHTRRLREVYRSAGWPWQDVVEIELLAAGLLERVAATSGHELVRITDAGISCMAGTLHDNRRAFSAHASLVNRVAQTMVRDGRVVWKSSMPLRPQLAPATSHKALHG